MHLTDLIMSINLITPQEMQRLIADEARALRLALNLSQQTLSEKSGVSFGTLKKFEQTGQISLGSLLKLALVLGRMDDFKAIFKQTPYSKALTLDELINDKKRKRGRK